MGQTVDLKEPKDQQLIHLYLSGKFVNCIATVEMKMANLKTCIIRLLSFRIHF